MKIPIFIYKIAIVYCRYDTFFQNNIWIKRIIIFIYKIQTCTYEDFRVCEFQVLRSSMIRKGGKYKNCLKI
jgi:hypothetical protein